MTCAVGSEIEFFASGTIKYATLAAGKLQKIKDLECAAGVEILFFESGAIEGAVLGSDQLIRGVTYMADKVIEALVDDGSAFLGFSQLAAYDSKGNPFVVAINKNAKAPIFQVADVGIVTDILDFLPELTEKIEEING